jgi:hypothetical protein
MVRSSEQNHVSVLGPGGVGAWFTDVAFVGKTTSLFAVSLKLIGDNFFNVMVLSVSRSLFDYKCKCPRWTLKTAQSGAIDIVSMAPFNGWRIGHNFFNDLQEHVANREKVYSTWPGSLEMRVPSLA